MRVSAEKATNPLRMNGFRIQVEIPQEMSDQYYRSIEDTVRHCLIHNTLLNAPSILLKILDSRRCEQPQIGP